MKLKWVIQPVGWGEVRTPPFLAGSGGVRTSPHPTSYVVFAVK